MVKNPRFLVVLRARRGLSQPAAGLLGAPPSEVNAWTGSMDARGLRGLVNELSERFFVTQKRLSDCQKELEDCRRISTSVSLKDDTA